MNTLRNIYNRVEYIRDLVHNLIDDTEYLVSNENMREAQYDESDEREIREMIANLYGIEEDINLGLKQIKKEVYLDVIL